MKAKSVDTVRELYFKEIKEGRNAFINNTKKIDYLYISNSSVDVCKNALGENTKYINYLCLYR